ncbi:MAG: DUF1566 domain-containing protein [Candidatus Cryptobacteroides sp.]
MMGRLSLLSGFVLTALMAVCCTKSPVASEEDSGKSDTGDEQVGWKVGDYYHVGLAKGVVAYVDENGEHGLLVSLEEMDLKWSTLSTSVIAGAVYVGLDDGAANVEGIKSLFPNWAEEFPAVAGCAAMNVGALNSWYLPAAAELRAVLDAAALNPAVSETLEANSGKRMTPEEEYWSSTDAGGQIAYAYRYRADMLPSDDLYFMPQKSSVHHVRCVRRF